MRHAPMGKAIVFCLVLALAGCTTGTYTYIKAYSGADLPKDQLALVKPIVGVIVISVDGDPSFASTTNSSFGFLEREMALPAGNHQIEVALIEGGLTSRGNTVMTLTTVPGHKYLLVYDIFGFGPTGMSWRPRFEDVTDTPERWCAMAGPKAFRQCRNG